MKLSLHWLGDFIDFTESDPQVIAERLTEAVAEVENVEVQGELLEHCCIGKVLKVSKHPNADKLHVCDVQTDKGRKRVVCGGTNLREGMRVAFAHVGARVKWHGEETSTLEKAKIRGEVSEGMICAAEELGLSAMFPECTGHNIVDLGESDNDIGAPLKEYLGLDDVVFHVDNHAITHRADLFSHVGFARECVAIGIAKWKERPAYALPTFPTMKLPFKVHNDCPKLVPRYLSCLISIEGLGQTPDWMRKRLEITGWRSVSLPVDITNYVTMEVGMPLHSFDAGDFRGDIRIRTAKRGEKIVTLDEVERALPEGAIVISDDEGIFDLLGIMGGLRSSTKESTGSVFLHSASLDPVSVRRSIIATGHRTEAATIYEKGVPRVTASNGFARALQLFLELVPGAKIASVLQEWGDDGTPKTIALSCDRTRSLLGVDISDEDISKALAGLEFTLPATRYPLPAAGTLEVQVPLHRLGDIHGLHDLIEEVGRIYGYNKIEPMLPAATIDPPARDHRIHQIRRGLKEQGYIEFLPLSLLGPDLLEKCNMDPADSVALENALGEELSLMQPCVCPRLIEHASENISLVEKELKTFHVGTIFADGRDACLALGVLCARRRKMDLKGSPLLTLKKDLRYALQEVGYTFEVRKAREIPAAAHPGRSAEITVGGETVGKLFEIHPTVLQRFELPERSAALLFNLSALLTLEPHTNLARGVARFPAVSYDVTVTMDHSKEVGDILEKLKEKSDLLESVEIADLYEGKPLKGGPVQPRHPGRRYNLTLRCTYRSKDRTLTEEEAQREHEKILAQFA